MSGPGAPIEEQAKAWAAAHAPGAPVVHSIVNLSLLPRQQAVLAVRNARAASRLIAALIGEPEAAEACTSDQLSAALGATRRVAGHRGFIDDSMAVEVSEELPHTAAWPLPGPALRALHGLLCAIQPEAEIGWWLVVLEPGSAPFAGPPALRDLISAVVHWDGADEEALDGTVFALACQQARPLQLVVDAPASAKAAADAVLARHLPLGTFEIAAAPEGRYLAFLEAGDLLHPQHHRLLRRALEQSSAAFAVARGRDFEVAKVSGDSYVKAKRDLTPLPADVAGLLRPGSLRGPAALFDRARVAHLDVNDPLVDPSERGEALARRLLSFTRPAVVAGVPSWERPARPARTTTAAEEPPLLLTVEELNAALAAAPAPSWLRYRVADAVSGALEGTGPVGPLIKSLVSRWRKK